MDRVNSRIAQVYGYAVCLICVIVFLVSLGGILGAAFDLTDPVRVESRPSGPGPTLPLTSFAAYKIAARRAESSSNTAVRSPEGSTNASVRPALLSDEELRQNFETERADRIGGVRFRAMRSIVIGLVFIVLTAALFLLHWRWLRRSNIEAMTT